MPNDAHAQQVTATDTFTAADSLAFQHQAVVAQKAKNVVHLPVEIRDYSWSELALWGIKRLGFGNQVTCPVEIPEGWQVRKGEHPDWSELIDGNGRSRADIYLCTNHCGTRAFIALRRRFTTITQMNAEQRQLRVRVMDGPLEVMFSTAWFDCVMPESENWPNDCHRNALEEAEQAAKTWLQQNLSCYRSCFHYWDFEF